MRARSCAPDQFDRQPAETRPAPVPGHGQQGSRQAPRGSRRAATASTAPASDPAPHPAVQTGSGIVPEPLGGPDEQAKETPQIQTADARSARVADVARRRPGVPRACRPMDGRGHAAHGPRTAPRREDQRGRVQEAHGPGPGPLIASRCGRHRCTPPAPQAKGPGTALQGPNGRPDRPHLDQARCAADRPVCGRSGRGGPAGATTGAKPAVSAGNAAR